jgi:CHAT domain-containing protein/Tfp pilus assembly protein PilF
MSVRSRPHFHGPLGLLVPVLALLLCGARDTQPSAPPALADGLSLERDLHGGEAHVYPVELQAGQFLRVIVQEEGIDVIVRLLDPQGAEVVGTDWIPARSASEDLAAVVREQGIYQVEVRAANPKSAPARYRLRVQGPRPAAGEDEVRAQATAASWEVARAQGNDEASQRRQIQALERALPFWERLQDTRRLAEAHFLLGYTGSQLQDLGRAVSEYRKSSDLWERLPDQDSRSWQVRSLNYEGMYLKELGRLDDAKAPYEKALAISRASGDFKGEGISLGNLGMLEIDQGALRPGIAKLIESLQRSRQAGDSNTVARNLSNLGFAHEQLAETQKAIEYYQQALDSALASSNQSAEAVALNNLGQTYLSLGDWETSIKNLERALKINRALRDRAQEGRTLINLGLAYQWTGRLEEARKAFHQAFAASTDPTTRTYARFRQAYLLLKLKQPAGAIESAREALELAKGFRDRETLALCALGVAHRDAGNLTAAREELTRALSMAHELADRTAEAEIGISLARTELEAGDRNAAVRQARSAIEILESFRTRIFDQRLRASFLASNQNYYEVYIDALMAGAGETRLAEALQASEQARARSLLDTLTESGADVREGLDPDRVEREHRLRETLNSLDSYRFRLLSEGASNHQKLTETEDRLEEALDQYRKAQMDLQASSPGYAALTEPRPLSLEEIRSQVLDGQAVLLEYALGAKRSFLWAVTPDAIRSFELPGRDHIEPLARRYYELLTARNVQRPGESLPARKKRIEAADAEAERAGRELSRMILAPVGSLLGERPLLIVADGALQYIPFAALPSPSSSVSLAARHEVVSLPSASALAALRRETRDRVRAPKALALFADPVFQATDERLTHKPSRMKLAATRGWSPAEARQYGGERSPSFPRLASSLREARTISALVPPDQLFLALGFQASRAAALRPELAQYRNLHFATHGVLDSRRPELSKLVLSLYDERGTPQDGFLRLNDVYNLRLDADLVVLSACQTALGQEVRGEGLIGLTRGFMYAGAARVLASLWSVEDRATADLMGDFYRGMLRQGLSPAAALRKAQLEMAKKPERKSPYYWAGFSLQGEWR